MSEEEIYESVKSFTNYFIHNNIENIIANM